MAYALNEATGWPIHVLTHTTSNGKETKHVVVRTPDGNYLDSLGVRNSSQLMAAFPRCELSALDSKAGNSLMNYSKSVSFYQEPRLDLARPLVAAVLRNGGYNAEANTAAQLIPPSINYQAVSLA